MAASTSRHTQEWDQLTKHEFAQYVLEEKGSYFPSLADMKASEPPADTLLGIKQHINELQGQLTRDLGRLYEHQARRHLDDALDRYLLFEESMMSEPPPPTRPDEREASETLKRFYESQRRILPSRPASTGQSTDSVAPSSIFSDEVARVLTAHYETIRPLQKRLTQLTKQEEERRRHRESMFPQSTESYHDIRNRDTRLRIARFLMAGSYEQNKILSEFGWAWRQTDALREDYKDNAEFRAEVQKRVKDAAVKDPRRKPSMAG